MIISNNFSSYYNQGRAVFVQPPTKRSVNFNLVNLHVEQDPLFKNVNGTYFLSFPYIGFSVGYVKNKKFPFPFIPSSLFLAFSMDAELKKIYYPALTNASSDDLNVCLERDLLVRNIGGNGPRDHRNTGFETIQEMCNSVISTFWQTQFNHHLSECLWYYVKSQKLLGNPIKWQEKTKLNPSWVPSSDDLVIYNEEYNYFFGKVYSD
jgi:hypothetical protein